MRLCFMGLPCDGVPGMGNILTLPQEVLDSFDARETYAATGEALPPGHAVRLPGPLPAAARAVERGQRRGWSAAW